MVEAPDEAPRRKWGLSVEGSVFAILGLFTVLIPMDPYLRALLWLVCLTLAIHIVLSLFKAMPMRVLAITVAVAGSFAGWWFTTRPRKPQQDVLPAPVPPVATSAPSAPSPLPSLTRRPRPGRPLATVTPTSPATPVPEPTKIPIVKYDYLGNKKTTTANGIVKTAGAEVEAYWKMWELAKGASGRPRYGEDKCPWLRLRGLAELEMRTVPDWVTPQVYAGIAEIHLYDPDRGEELLQGAEQRIGNDPDYAGILPLIRLQLKGIADSLTRAILSEQPVSVPKGSTEPTETPCP